MTGGTRPFFTQKKKVSDVRAGKASTFHLEVTMKLYPLVFSFRDIIAGNGYVAVVSMDGRVVLSEEDDQDFWMFGVQPGGIAGGEKQREAAFTEFKKTYLSVLFDIAAEVTSFEEFKERTTAFFAEVNEPNAADWERSLMDVRSNNLSLTGLKPVKAGAVLPSLTIENVAPASVSSGANEFDQISEAA